MNHPETVEVQMQKTADNPTGVVIINKSELTDEHILVQAEKAPHPKKTVPVPPVEVKAPEATETTAPGATPAPWAKPAV